jgi:hypothetical protein
MEPEGSLPCSQEPSTGPYPEPDQSNPYHPILSLKIHFNIAQPHTSWGHQNFLYVSINPFNLKLNVLFPVYQKYRSLWH